MFGGWIRSSRRGARTDTLSREPDRRHEVMNLLSVITRWEVPPSIAVGLVTLLGAYLMGIRAAKREEVQEKQVSRGQVTAFLGGVVTLFVALTGPLDDLADHFLFSMHMIQHLLLMLVAAPLLLAGIPTGLLTSLLRPRPLLGLARVLTRPMIAFWAFNGVLIAWHVPACYNWALANEHGHILMHLCFIGGAILGWWPLIGSVPELPRPAPVGQLLYAGLISLPMMVVAACVTLADSPLYAAYAAAPRLWGLSPQEDQVIGGVLMWVPAQWLFILPLTIVFFRWVRDEADTKEERL
jgi:putative membrane protein